MSYVQVYARGSIRYGHVVYPYLGPYPGEHPIERVARWNATHGKTDGFTVVLLSFQQVGDFYPDADVLSMDADIITVEK